MGISTINGHFQVRKLLVYQRVMHWRHWLHWRSSSWLCRSNPDGLSTFGWIAVRGAWRAIGNKGCTGVFAILLLSILHPWVFMEVSSPAIRKFPENEGSPRSSIFMRVSPRNHPFLGIPISGTPHLALWDITIDLRLNPETCGPATSTHSRLQYPSPNQRRDPTMRAAATCSIMFCVTEWGINKHGKIGLMTFRSCRRLSLVLNLGTIIE